MRITVVLSTFPQFSETFIVSKFVGLIDLGHHVSVVCNTLKPDAWNAFPALNNAPHLRQNVHVQWLVKPIWITALLLPLQMLWLLLRVPVRTRNYLVNGYRMRGLKVLRDLYIDAPILLSKPDIIHFEFGALAVNRVHIGEWIGAKVVVSFRGYDINYVGLENPDFYQSVWEKADHLHFLGSDLRKRAIRRGCPEDKPYSYVPPALNPNQFRPSDEKRGGVLGTAENPLQLLSVGRLSWKKGYEFALQAAHLLDIADVHIIYRIIGSGNYTTPLYFARHQLDLESVVTFTGRMPHEAIIEQLEWADIFLHAAVSEGFCNAVLEAQAMQVPVVASDADGLSENVSHGKTGFIVPRRNAQALADQIRLLAYTPELRLEMGRSSRKRVQKHFTLERQLDLFDEMYRRTHEN